MHRKRRRKQVKQGETHHIALASANFAVVDQAGLLKNLHYIGLPQNAGRLDVGLGNVHIERVEGNEHSLIEGHSRRSVAGAHYGIGSVLVDRIARGKVLGICVDL